MIIEGRWWDLFEYPKLNMFKILLQIFKRWLINKFCCMWYYYEIMKWWRKHKICIVEKSDEMSIKFDVTSPPSLNHFDTNYCNEHLELAAATGTSVLVLLLAFFCSSWMESCRAWAKASSSSIKSPCNFCQACWSLTFTELLACCCLLIAASTDGLIFVFFMLASQSWSLKCLCFKQKFILHTEHEIGTNSFFLQFLKLQPFVKILGFLEDLQFWSMWIETETSGKTSRGVGTGSLHNGHTGTWKSFL